MSGLVIGTAAGGSSGNPAFVTDGGIASNVMPSTVANGQRINIWTGPAGQQVVAVGNTSAINDSATTQVYPIAYSDGLGRPLGVATQVWNGSALVQQRGDTSGTYCTAGPAAGTDRSITTSTTSQQLMAANTSRHGFYVKNDTAIVVYINIGATAVATPGGGNIAIAANGGYYESPASVTPSSVVNIIAVSGTPAITAREF